MIIIPADSERFSGTPRRTSDCSSEEKQKWSSLPGLLETIFWGPGRFLFSSIVWGGEGTHANPANHEGITVERVVWCVRSAEYYPESSGKPRLFGGLSMGTTCAPHRAPANAIVRTLLPTLGENPPIFPVLELARGHLGGNPSKKGRPMMHRRCHFLGRSTLPRRDRCPEAGHLAPLCLFDRFARLRRP